MKNIRLYLVFALMIIIAGVASFRLFDIQISSFGEWKSQAQGQQIFFQQTKGERGEIYMQNMKGDTVPLAVNNRVYNAYISPRETEDKSVFVDIAEALGLNKEFVEERMERNSSYEVLKRRIAEKDAKELVEVEGLYLEEEIIRYYPQGRLASHVLGFLGGEGVGQYGVEQYYENIIGGKEGIREGRKGSNGFFTTRDTTEKGLNIVLTIDYNIQHFAEKLLIEAYEEFGMVEGSILVGDPHTGKILALANNPGFNPNHYSEVENTRVFRNQVVQDFFEPGSIFKPITMAMALDALVVDVDDTYDDKGSIKIHGRTIYNYGRRAWGEVTMTEILEKSINTGIVSVSDRLGKDLFLEYMENFGFFEKTGVDLHGEVASRNENILEMHDVNFATASYGHGIQVTTMQVFRAFSVLANGGKMITPHIVTGMGEEIGERIISHTAVSQLTDMLVSVVGSGSGWRAGVPGYYVAGKTGTAQIPWSVLGVSKSGYSNETIQSFVGYAPAYDPQFVIIVLLDRPNTVTSELSAAPIFGELARYMLNYMQIPHDYNEE